MDYFAEFVQRLTSEVKNISDSLRMHKYLNEMQTLSRRWSEFRKWVGEMKHYFILVSSSEDQRLKTALLKTGCYNLGGTKVGTYREL